MSDRSTIGVGHTPMTPMMTTTKTTTAAVLVLLGAASLGGCKEPIVEAGPLQDLVVSLRLLPLPDEEQNAIGSFDVEVRRNGAVAATFGLAYDPDTGAVSFVDAPPELEAGGVVEASVIGRRLDGSEAGVGGRAVPVDLDLLADLPEGSPVTVPVLVGRLDAMTPLGIDLDEARFQHSATLVGGVAGGGGVGGGIGGGVLVVGGVASGVVGAPGALATTVEWIDPVGGAHCSSAPGAVGGGRCLLDEAPPPRVGHVAVGLGAFEARCPVRGALVAGGADEAGVPRADAWILVDVDENGGTFERLPDLPRARAGGAAVVLQGCRVLIAGGHDAAGAPIAALDVVDLSAGVAGASIAEVGALPIAVDEPLLLATGNALDEVIVVGGRDADGNPQQTGVSISVGDIDGDPAVVVCDLADAGCNGGGTRLACARAGAAASVIDVRSDIAPTLIVGGDDDGSCEGAELFYVGVEAPFAAFVTPVGAAGVDRDRGATVTAVAGERAVVIGGEVDGGVGGEATVLADVELFGFLASPADATGVAAGGFVVVGDLATARAHHSATAVAGAVVVVGGMGDVDGGGAPGPLSSIEVFVPGFTGAAP